MPERRSGGAQGGSAPLGHLLPRRGREAAPYAPPPAALGPRVSRLPLSLASLPAPLYLFAAAAAAAAGLGCRAQRGAAAAAAAANFALPWLPGSPAAAASSRRGTASRVSRRRPAEARSPPLPRDGSRTHPCSPHPAPPLSAPPLRGGPLPAPSGGAEALSARGAVKPPLTAAAGAPRSPGTHPPVTAPSEREGNGARRSRLGTVSPVHCLEN